MSSAAADICGEGVRGHRRGFDPPERMLARVATEERHTRLNWGFPNAKTDKPVRKVSGQLGSSDSQSKRWTEGAIH